jgi:hypothetical protein
MRLIKEICSRSQKEGLSRAITCSSFLQNMSCRPRTTVHSRGLTAAKLPARLQGEKIVIDPGWNIPGCLRTYAGENPEMGVPIFDAVLTLGNRCHSKTYMHFIKSRADHEQSLMKWVSHPPAEVAALPGVGFIKRTGTVDDLTKVIIELSLHACLFIMARSNSSVYIRNKSPLLSLISIDRRLQIIFAGRRE